MGTNTLPSLARRLIAEGLLDETKAQMATQQAEKSDIPLISYLVNNQIIDGYTIAKMNSELFGLPLFDISAINFETVPHNCISEKLMTQYRCFPLYKRGKRLFVGMSDPTNTKAIDEIRFSSGSNIQVVLVEEDKIGATLDKAIANSTNIMDELNDENLDLSIDSDPVEEEEESSTADDKPVARFVNKMLLSAIKMGASDLHFEPYEKKYRIRFRVDGIMQLAAEPPIALAPRISSRLKIMSRMDISERKKSQDGRISLRLSRDKKIDFRANTLPTLWGEKVVLRALDPSSAQIGIEALGFTEQQKELYLKYLHQPQGLILVTGPTGSGKTVSLYTGLNLLNTIDKNISTVEDPVEINLDGINQVAVNYKQGLDFAHALRAFLRQDPDVIMVGEMRDLETASIAIKAAQTGHMVMSTLHTNSAAETLTRLLNMGIPSFNLATSVSLIIAQRLARRLCDSCKVEAHIPREALLQQGMSAEQIDGAVIYTANSEGCSKCSDGYKGRVGIYEVVALTPALQQLIMEEKSSLELAQQARQDGFDDLRHSGLLSVLCGKTSLEEINRVTHV